VVDIPVRKLIIGVVVGQYSSISAYFLAFFLFCAFSLAFLCHPFNQWRLNNIMYFLFCIYLKKGAGDPGNVSMDEEQATHRCLADGSDPEAERIKRREKKRNRKERKRKQKKKRSSSSSSDSDDSSSSSSSSSSRKRRRKKARAAALKVGCSSNFPSTCFRN
jgi:hypothetical protein